MVSGFVILVPIGEVSQDLIQWIRNALTDALGCDVILGDAIPLSDSWYDDGRGQYRGTELLRALRGVPRPEHGRMLGLADVDCSGVSNSFARDGEKSDDEPMCGMPINPARWVFSLWSMR